MIADGMAGELLEECEGFEWDTANSGKIWDRHRVSPAECEEIFFNRPCHRAEDEAHSTDEARMYGLGQSDAGRLMFVAFTIRERLIRVISARDMSRKERRFIGRHEKAMPKFKNEDAERKFWATHDSTDYIDWRKASGRHSRI